MVSRSHKHGSFRSPKLTLKVTQSYTEVLFAKHLQIIFPPQKLLKCQQPAHLCAGAIPNTGLGQ